MSYVSLLSVRSRRRADECVDRGRGACLPLVRSESSRVKTGAFTVGDLGFLSALLFMFANQQSLFPSGHFEQVESELTLVVAVGGRNAFRLRSEINPDREHLNIGSGHVHERDSLKTLTRNHFFEAEERSGEVRIRLGKAGKELLGVVDEKAATPPSRFLVPGRTRSSSVPDASSAARCRYGKRGGSAVANRAVFASSACTRLRREERPMMQTERSGSRASRTRTS